MIEFGRGPTLVEACPYLRDPEERARRILEVVERDSVIEGLPPFTAEMRDRLHKRLIGTSEPQSEPRE